MAKRSSVSREISKSVIWISSTDYLSTIEAIKIHDILTEDIGYQDGSCLEVDDNGTGVSITVCSADTIKEMAENYMYAKRESKSVETTQKHKDLAIEYLDQLYDYSWRLTDKQFIKL